MTQAPDASTDGPAPQPTSQSLVWQIRVLAAAALSLAAYLAYVSLSGGAAPGCGDGSMGCGQVLGSRWSTVLGVPVSLLAVGVYLGVLAATLGLGPAAGPARRRMAWSALAALAVMMLGAAVWYVGLQAFSIGVICPYCMADHVAAVALAVLIFAAAPLALRRALAAGAVGLLAVAILIGGQLAFQPRLMRVIPMLNGKLEVNLADAPILGSPDAPNVIISIYDYACPHCRNMHGYLTEARRRYGDQLAIVTLPAPLNSDCNPLIHVTDYRFKESCKLAKLALAVWRVRPKAYDAFHDWMFAVDRKRWADETRKHAIQVVGDEAALDNALADPWIDQQIAKAIHIHKVTDPMGGDGPHLPKIITGNSFMLSRPADADELCAALEKSLPQLKPLTRAEP